MWRKEKKKDCEMDTKNVVKRRTKTGKRGRKEGDGD